MSAAPEPGATVAEKLAWACDLLSPVTETPRLDAEILLARTLGISRAVLLARLREPCSAPDFTALVERRLAYEPLAYILGEWEFFSLSFKVAPPLLVPRPETEHLVEEVLARLEGHDWAEAPARVLEIGTGTGCVAVSVAHAYPVCTVTATDINPLALRIADENAQRMGVAERVNLREGSLFDALDASEKPFDIICSNPPYVESGAWDSLSPVIRFYEDPGALLAGEDGLDIVRQIVRTAPAYLKPGGLLAFEIGESQAPAVAEVLTRHGFENVRFRKDLAGIDRIACADRGGNPAENMT